MGAQNVGAEFDLAVQPFGVAKERRSHIRDQGIVIGRTLAAQLVTHTANLFHDLLGLRHVLFEVQRQLHQARDLVSDGFSDLGAHQIDVRVYLLDQVGIDPAPIAHTHLRLQKVWRGDELIGAVI